jgi:membrane fusion protein (multidrug efflux system)
MQRSTAIAARLGALVIVVGACSNKASPAPPPPRPEVSVLTVAPQTIPAQYEFVGQAAAYEHVEVRAQVSGIIVARPYREGTDVSKGTVLFRIDPTTYEAAYRSARAQLANARAALANAERNLRRLIPLLADHAVAQKDVDDARTAEEQARASVQNAQATVDQAKKNYDNTFVRAEVNGRAGRAQMVLGALVAGPSDLLTTVDEIDPIYVNFSPSDQDVLRWRRDVAARRLIIPSGPLDVRAVLADGSVMRHTGTVNFIDLTLQPATGTLQLRAAFPNPEHALLPGQFVRVQLLGVRRTGAILVPQRAIQQGLNGAYVYVLGDSGKVESRNVAASNWAGGWWIVDGGLSAGDRVLVDGLQKVAVGQAVRTIPFQAAGDTTLSTRMDSTIYAAPSAAPPVTTPRSGATRP